MAVPTQSFSSWVKAVQAPLPFLLQFVRLFLTPMGVICCHRRSKQRGSRSTQRARLELRREEKSPGG